MDAEKRRWKERNGDTGQDGVAKLEKRMNKTGETVLRKKKRK